MNPERRVFYSNRHRGTFWSFNNSTNFWDWNLNICKWVVEIDTKKEAMNICETTPYTTTTKSLLYCLASGPRDKAQRKTTDLQNPESHPAKTLFPLSNSCLVPAFSALGALRSRNHHTPTIPATAHARKDLTGSYLTSIPVCDWLNFLSPISSQTLTISLL